MNMNSTCYLCHLKKQVDTARPLGTEAQLTAFTRDLMQLYLDSPVTVSAPWFSPQVNALFQKHYGTPEDRFQEEKALSNRFVVERLPRLQAMAEAAEDPVYAGLQLALLGNYIDFSALFGEVSFETLDEMLENFRDISVEEAVYRRFCADLAAGKELLYVTDNAGEIGFDRVFAEQLQKRFPHLRITFCVRGGPTLNDATRADAQAVGIPFPVIDNGNLISGTQPDALGEEAKQAFARADVILCKGQANVETLYGCGWNVYYAFLCKCQRFVEEFQKPKLSPMLLAERK